MADALVVPEAMPLTVKEECAADAAVSDIPVFTSTRQPTHSASKPDGEVMPSSSSAADALSATIISNGMPATPYSLHSLPATPPFETVEFDADKVTSATAATATAAAELPAARPVTQLMNETPSDSASEPHSEQARPEQPAVRMYRFRPEFIPARRSPPGQSRDDTDSPEPLPRRVASNRRKSSRKSQSAWPAKQPKTAPISPDSAPADSSADGSAAVPGHPDSPELPHFTDNSLASQLAPLSPITAEDASEAAEAIDTPTHQTPTPADNTTSFVESTPNAADDSIASRRPVRSVRQAKPASQQESPRPARPAARSASNTDSKPASPAPAASAKKAVAKSTSQLGAPASVERRATRFSGLPSELAAPQPASLGKRRRSESDKNLVSDVPRELKRLQDTKEYKHVDDDPVVYTVWSNGKYVPANAAGEPLPDKTKRAKPTKDADSSKGEAGTPSAQDAPADDDAALDAPRPVQKRFKKWMTKGLYAGQAMPRNPTSGLTTAEKKSLAKIPELTKEYPPNKTLPMPIYNGLRMLLQGRDFKLPFDVFNPLPPGQPKPVKFGKFNKNRFVGEAHSIWKKSPNYDDCLTKCVCKPETGCDEDCQNRIMLYECNDMICNVGAEHCSNREFQRLGERTASKNAYNIGVEVFKTPNRGHGIRASRGFRPGQIIMEYIGEIITEEESDRRMNELYKDNECYYLMSFDQSLIIDGTSGSVARFVNHSCDPNCRMIKWIVSGQPRIALFAGDRTIQTGEELTYDYNFDPYSSKNVQSCLCGSENCRGILGPRKSEKAVSKAAAAAEKTASDKAKSGSAANQKKPANGASKRKHDVYSMDDNDDDPNGAPAAKKMRTAQGQQQNSQVTKKVSKASTAKAIMTTKAALEALAADAAKKARLEKASKAAKAARAARAAKAAEELKAAEAAKKAKTAKATKTAKASPSRSKSAKTLARGAKATTTKASKPIKVVKAVQSVKVVKTAKGLKASKTSTKTKATESKTVTKTTKTVARKAAVTKTTKTAATKTTVKFVKPAAAAKSAKAQKPKTSLAQRAETPQNTASTSEAEATPQATPMAQAVAKAAKEAAAAKDAAKEMSPTTAHKSVKFIKKARSASKEDSAVKKMPARHRQVPKKVVDITQAGVSRKMDAKSVDFLQKTTFSLPGIPGENDEIEEQLYRYLEMARGKPSEMAQKANPPATLTKSRAGRISKPTAAARSARRGLGRARKASVNGDDVSEEIEDVSMFDDDRMLLDEPGCAGIDEPGLAEDTIHVAGRQE